MKKIKLFVYIIAGITFLLFMTALFITVNALL